MKLGVLFGVIWIMEVGFDEKDEKNKEVGNVIGIEMGKK